MLLFNHMVEYSAQLDDVFFSLSDPTRRGILQWLLRGEALSIGEIADNHQLTFAAISKHIKVLEKAGLVIKRRQGVRRVVTLCPEALHTATTHLEQYRLLWDDKLNRLEQLLNEKEKAR